MDVPARSFLTSAVAAISAATLALTPSVLPTVARLADPGAVRLTSAAELISPDPLDAALSAMPLPPDLVDAAALDPVSLAAGSIGADIEAFYNAVEPWVAYEVNFLSWAVGWVPVAGLLAPQLIFVYDLGESITQSLVFNTADLLDGTVTFSEALSNIGAATTDAFNAFVTTEIDWINSMLPPVPPIAADLGGLADLGTLFGLLP